MNVRDLTPLEIDKTVNVTGKIVEIKTKHLINLNGLEDILFIILEDVLTKDKIILEIPKVVDKSKDLENRQKISVNGIVLKEKELKNGEIRFKIKVSSLDILLNATELGFRNAKSLRSQEIIMVKQFLQEMKGETIEEKELKKALQDKFNLSYGKLDEIFDALSKEVILFRPKRGYIQIIDD